ncbi:MAG: UMP kinase [bacterium]|nr:UMP kinase [bacterium]
MEKQTIVISLGGSIISHKPGEVNVEFLKKFRSLILNYLKQGYRFVIIPGGGKVCRLYQAAASQIAKAKDEDKDWIGIHSIRLNAHLLRTIFRDVAYPVVFDNPKKNPKGKWKVLIASAWLPGHSSDHNAVSIAQKFGIKEIINAGNISFVFDKDPAKFENAKHFEKISWRDYRKIIGSKWIPGLSSPFDPIASKLAEKLKIRVFILEGTDIKNFEKAISGETFRGTIISSER